MSILGTKAVSPVSHYKKSRSPASKHRAMSYCRIAKKHFEFARDLEKLLTEAEAPDDKEDEKCGKDERGDELPKDLRFKADAVAPLAGMRDATKDSRATWSVKSGTPLGISTLPCALQAVLERPP